MKIRTFVICCGLWSSLGGLSAGETAELVELMQLRTWSEPEGSGPANTLAISHLEPQSMHKRTLVVYNGSVAMSVDALVKPPSGETTITVWDHLSDWSVSLKDVTDFRSDQPYFYANSLALADTFLAEDHSIERRLITGQAPDFSFSSTLWDSQFEANFYRQMESEGCARRLGEGMPPSARRGVRLIQAFLNSDSEGGGPGGVFGEAAPLITLLSSVLDSSEEKAHRVRFAASRWESKVEATTTDLQKIGGGFNFPLHRFAGIDPEDPLKGGPPLLASRPSPEPLDRESPRSTCDP